MAFHCSGPVVSGKSSGSLACLSTLLVVVVVVGACQKEAPDGQAPLASASAKARLPIDRLAPGELEPGREALFGLALPRDMQVQGKFKDSGLAAGPMSLESVANYVRDRVLAEHVEVGATGSVFPAARIKDAPEDRIYRIEVLREGTLTRLLMEDITPTPEVKVEPANRTDAMRRAGFSPEGTPLNLKELE